MVSVLEMYDLTVSVRSANDAWFSHLMESNLSNFSSLEVQSNLFLTRNHQQSLAQLGETANLFIGQTCGFPLILNPKSFRVLGIPQYAVHGCSHHFYRSVIITKEESQHYSLESFRNKSYVYAINSACSLSGNLLLQATLGSDLLSFGSPLVTGAHFDSITAVREGRADIAAIDCVTFALIAANDPSHLVGVKVLGYTPKAPSLPYVTSFGASEETVTALRKGLKDAVATLDSVVKDTLLLRDFKVEVSDEELREAAASLQSHETSFVTNDSENNQNGNSSSGSNGNISTCAGCVGNSKTQPSCCGGNNNNAAAAQSDGNDAVNSCRFVSLYELYIAHLRRRAADPSQYILYSSGDDY